ncbi:MAG TPA: hypothetical protein PLO84_09185 [Thermotogota bacterium]|nr:hypothetical protein [Thermotogota bacterium]
MKLQKSQFNFLHYEVRNIDIKVLKRSREANNFDYSVESAVSDIVYQDEYASFGLKLTIVGEYEEEKFREVNFEIVGVFDGFKEMGKEKFEKFCMVSGVANLLQASRSTISAFSSLMNLYPPINLPLFDLRKSIEDQKKRDK